MRQASLAPQLKERAVQEAASSSADAGQPARERSPEEARATFTSFQRGYTRGRGADRARTAPAAPAVPGAPARPTLVPAWQPPDPSRRAIAPAPAPPALPAPPRRTAPPAPPAPPAPAEGTDS
ncbi:hypothetical protein ACWEQL_39610 [Kitasatospora sp. NPDC004240]